ncbi:MAG: AbrB/MazE/SpoVT family DNA-binding domain-containing protein [Thermodesulfovibrionales bacterium]
MTRTRRGKVDVNTPIVVTRKVIKSGRSFYISIPPAWLKKHNIGKGDALPIVADTLLKIVPVSEI